MRAKAKLRRIGLADHDHARRAQPRHKDIIVLRHLPRKDRRSLRADQTFCIGQILDCHWHTVKRTALIHRHRICCARLCHQLLGRAQGNNRIEFRVALSDPRKRGLHQSLGGQRPARKVLQNLGGCPVAKHDRNFLSVYMAESLGRR